MRYLTVYERKRNEISRRLREKYKKCDISPIRERKKCDISPFMAEVQEIRYLAVYERTRNVISRAFTREQEIRYLAVYERARNAIFRRLWEKYKKFDISPFTREQEIRYLPVYERSTRNALNQTGWRDSDRAKHNLTRIFNLPLKNGHEWYTLCTSADFFSTILTSATR